MNGKWLVAACEDVIWRAWPIAKDMDEATQREYDRNPVLVSKHAVLLTERATVACFFSRPLTDQRAFGASAQGGHRPCGRACAVCTASGGGHSRALRSVIFLRDGRLMSTGGDGLICVWSLTGTGDYVRPRPGSVLSPDQNIEGTSADSTSKWVLCLCELRACPRRSPAHPPAHLCCVSLFRVHP